MVFCSGKHYYTLDSHRKKHDIKDTAIIRVEVRHSTEEPIRLCHVSIHFSCCVPSQVLTFTKNSNAIPEQKVCPPLNKHDELTVFCCYCFLSFKAQLLLMLAESFLEHSKSLYTNAELSDNLSLEVIWSQEEPENMGPWSFVEPRFRRQLNCNVSTSQPSFC